MIVRTRIAPSPTGRDVHVGSIATALMNYAWAKKHGGQFIIRIEDTDQSRLVAGGEKRMLDTFDEIGLKADESPKVGGPYVPYRQSERLEIYKKYAEELVGKGTAYYCNCSKERLDEVRKQMQLKKKIPRYDRNCRDLGLTKDSLKDQKYVVRLKVPDNKEIVIEDLVRGTVKFNTNDIDDQVLLKSDGFPTYHLGVVVDDHLMNITYVIRGEEWLPSTPKHVLLFKAFGFELPKFAHVSLLRNPDRSKLSKRKNPVWTSEYLEKGILPEALLNYLSLMGWSHPEGKDIFALDEYVEKFDIKDVATSAPIFDPVKLEWMNGEYIRKMTMSKLKNQISKFYKSKFPDDILSKTIPLIQERIKKLSDYESLCEFFYERPKQYEMELKNHKSLLKEIVETLSKLTKWESQDMTNALTPVVAKNNMKTGDFFMILRVAITGKRKTPPLNDSMVVLGKEECLARLSELSS